MGCDSSKEVKVVTNHSSEEADSNGKELDSNEKEAKNSNEKETKTVGDENTLESEMDPTETEDPAEGEFTS